MQQARKASRMRALAEDRRAEPRLAIGGDIRLTLLSDSGDSTVSGRVVNLSGRGLSLLLPRPLSADTPVRIDVEGKTLLGEVIHSTLGRDGYLVGVELQQSVTWTRDLMRLIDALADPQ